MGDLDWLIIGGGIHGTHLSLVLMQRGGVAAHRLRVLDPYPTPLVRWHECTRNCGMAYLRSGGVHHIGLDPEDLGRFAARQPNPPTPHFIPPYRRPALTLFQQHCDHIIATNQLDQVRLVGRATALRRHSDGWQVETEHGSLTAHKVALAMGSMEYPAIPAWASPLIAQGAAIDHIFTPGMRRDQRGAWQRCVVVGGGISAVQLALTLAAQQPGTVTLLLRHPLREHQLDSDPGWLGPKYQDGFRALRDYTERRTQITRARHRGSVPPDLVVQLRQAIQQGQLAIQHAAVVAAQSTPTTGITLCLDVGPPLTADWVLLATGFAPERPGGAWLTETIHTADLPLAPCGFPIAAPDLHWGQGLYVLGALAELELGPIARNIAGARQAAERIVQSRYAEATPRTYRAMRGRG